MKFNNRIDREEYKKKKGEESEVVKLRKEVDELKKISKKPTTK